MFTQTKWKSKLLTIWITLLNQLELLDHTLLSDVILNIMKCCTQKLRDRVSTIYFTIRKDAPDRGIRQVPDDNWYPAAKSVHGLGPQTRDSMVKDRLGYGGSCDSSRDQVQKLLPEISSHGPALVSLPMEQPLPVSPAALCQSWLWAQAEKAPQWERICSGSLQHSCLHANMLLLSRIQHFS